MKRLPTATKKLTGNRSKKPLPKNEPQPDLGAAPPEPPEWLDEVAAVEWRRLSRQLWLNGILGLEDWTAFAGYCESFSDWMRYNEMIAQTERHLREHARARGVLDRALGAKPSDPTMKDTAFGHVIEQGGRAAASPLVKLRNDARRDCLKFASEFGLTPSSRSRVSVPRGAGGAALPKADAQTKTATKRPVDFLNRGPRGDNVVPLKA